MGPPPAVAPQGLDDVPINRREDHRRCILLLCNPAMYTSFIAFAHLFFFWVSDELACCAATINTWGLMVRVYHATPASAALSCAAMSARNRESLRPISSRYVPDSDIRPSWHVRQYRCQENEKKNECNASTHPRAPRSVLPVQSSTADAPRSHTSSAAAPTPCRSRR